MVKRFVKLIAICAMILPIGLTSCQKELYDPTVTVVSQEATDLDFSTTQNVKFDLSYNVPTGFVAGFDLYTENPCEIQGYRIVLKEGVKPIGSGVAVSGKFTNTKQLPGFVKDLYAYSSNYFAPLLMHATIQDDIAKFDIVDMSSDAGTKASTRNASNGSSDFSIKTNIDNGKVVTITSDMITRINTAFPDQKRVDDKYYTDASLYLQQDAQVWVTPLVTDGVLVNELLYFCYDGKKEDLGSLTTAQRANLPLITVFHGKIAPGDLQIGTYVKLKYYKNGQYSDTFPAGTTIGWALRPHYNGVYQNLTFYSCAAWNPENGTTVTKNHTIYFNAGTTDDPFVCFGFEDMPNDKRWNNFGDNDCNDMMFNVQLNPINALDPPPIIEPDPKDIINSQKYVGYLGYEDYWPVYFDYDLNDLLVKYQSTVNTKTQTGKGADTNTYITSIEDNYTMVFTGADFNNKFAVKVPFSQSLVDKVTITSGSNTQTIQGTSLEKDLDGFILDVCNDPHSLIEPYNRVTVPHTCKVVITLKDKALTMANFENNAWMAPYNPFITPISPQFGRIGNLEVHLPGYMPTQRVIHVDHWFGKFDDRSNITLGIYYIGGDKVYDTEGNFIEKNICPFAIHLSGVEDFYIPIEQQRIDKTFPKYRQWAESGMTTNKDWYLYHP